jgi:hypothetical protein
MKKNGYGINVKETPFHLRTGLTKNRHLEVATRSSTQWETPHHTESPKWSRKNNQVDKSPDTIHVCMLVSEISGTILEHIWKKNCHMLQTIWKCTYKMLFNPCYICKFGM